ncbi:hypothetical protein AOQ84DRAFT_400730 [Glonium stellatum]|uniref:Uncharacterized protein n=1 Tax=Glonium stellatum TaxID=574774 RepID=A0A8E2ER61_9PEZI|nr:hypothetical protein AOQ84DRAFT_400730 [Glonium stellatum]
MPSIPPSSAGTSQHRILLLSLDKQSWFDEMYNRLITAISDRAVLQRATGSAVMQELKEYVSNGGTVVFGRLFSSFISPADMNAFFRRHFDLPWESGDYHRTTLHLKPSYSQKAVFLKNVGQTAALYLPSEQSKTENRVFSAEPIRGREQTPVAWKRISEGWIGYIGDVNGEEGNDGVILGMCGL